MQNEKGYIKLWLSYQSYFEPYSAAEVGNLVLAMMEYRATGKEPEFDGSERFVWPAIRRDIDASIEAQESIAQINRENGKRGGRPKKSENPDGFSETEENPKNPMGFSEIEKSHGQGKGKGQGKGQGQGDITRARRFTPPTLAEVQSYVAERHSAVDPQGFIDFYESKGWMVGKTPMKDWKAACRNAENWERWKKTAPAAQNMSEDAWRYV